MFVLALIDGVESARRWLLVLADGRRLSSSSRPRSRCCSSVLYVRFRDVQPIWEVALQLLFWGTPIIYTIEFVPDGFASSMMFNPLAVAIQQARHWLVDAAAAIGRRRRSAGRAGCSIPLAVFVLLVAVEWHSVFRRAASRIAEDL